MARCGAAVTISGRSIAPLRQTCREIGDQGVRAQYVVADITNAADLQQLVQSAMEFGDGKLDCWVNNAGGASPQDVGPLMDMTEAQWDAVVDTNLKWTFFACQAAARGMPNGGSIINISSRSGSQPNPMTGQYGAAKAGLENLTATMAVEWGHLGIRVNAIAPGVVITEDNERAGASMSSESRRRRQIETIPLRRLGTVDDIGPLCVYLASDEASWTTGETIQVHGGSRITVGYLSYLHRMSSRSVDSTNDGAN
jgi:3-oxoacyl-[acyl-carrier protein] reductase